MFENVLGQTASKILQHQAEQNTIPPALLFAGSEASGKLTAALELARVLCCTQSGAWGCSCESCSRQKELTAPDVLVIGARDIMLEIRAAAQTFLTVKNIPARYLFVRAIRKLTIRFDPRLWDSDEPRFSKAAPLLSTIEETLTDFLTLCTDLSAADETKLEKKITKLIDTCTKLQETCMYDTIPVNQVRKAAQWVRLMPTGKKKIFIVENADKMHDSARNAFLKILEEPPEYAVFILTTQRRSAIIPTILSRVRTYTFADRDSASQRAVIERVFRNTEFCETLAPDTPVRITDYLNSFLPVSREAAHAAAALFWRYTFRRMQQERKPYPQNLGKVIAGFHHENPSDEAETINGILKLVNNGKPHRMYILFLECLTSFLQKSIRLGCAPLELEHYARYSELLRQAAQSVEIFNANPQAVLENLAEQITALS